MGKMKELKIEIEEEIYRLENLESELVSINNELSLLQGRKRVVEEALEDLRTKFKFYKVFFQGRRNN